tara:strand:- start:699 stop:1172 length:474 start_codon:yes stop_codon:yes gene_type:complete
MSLKIRLTRGGAKKRPYYRIVVADARAPRDGRFIERIGSYNPMLPKDAQRVVLDLEKAKAWIAKGAQPTDRVGRFIHEMEAEAWAWKASSNLKKGEPGQKAKELAQEKADKEEARKTAIAEAKAAKEAPVVEEAPAEEAPAAEAEAEAPAAEEAKSE